MVEIYFAKSGKFPELLRWVPRFFCFVFWPSRFVEEATRHAIDISFKTNQQLRNLYSNGELPDEKVAEYREGVRARTQKLRRSILWSLPLVIMLFVAAWITAYTLASRLHPFAQVLRFGSAGLILWAILGRLGWSIQTYKGITLEERLNNGWFLFAYSLGIYSLVLSMLISG